MLAALLAGSARASDPTFSASSIATGMNAISVVAANLNGDGFNDLAVANQGPENVSILLGTGSGGFGSPTSVPTGGTDPVGVTAALLNGDGFMDLAVANEASNNVSILLGNGSGGFNPAAGSPIPLAAGSLPQQIAVGAFDADATLDLAVLNEGDGTNPGTISILLGTGSGSFAAAGSPIAVGIAPKAIVAGNFNAGTTIDLATVNEGDNNVSILLGNGAGGFIAAGGSPITVGTGPSAIGTADLNGNGTADLFVANAGSNNVSILLGNGTGAFAPAGSPVSVGSSPEGVASADFNLDGKLDVAAANADPVSTTLSILLGNGTGGFSAAGGSPVTTGTQPTGLTAAHLNGDTKPDLVSANYSGGNVTVQLNTTPATPTAVTLSSFVARATRQGVELRWRTVHETSVLGFHVYRSGARVNGTLIHARGSGAVGTAYRLLDRSARIGGASRYRLQAVRADGTRAWLGRASTQR